MIPDRGIGFKALCGSIIGEDPMSIEARAKRELARAHRARRDGNEGRARVCARRAAGWAASSYYERKTGMEAPRSALSILTWLRDDESTADEIRAIAMRLTAHVTPSHELPFDEDPLEDAQRMIDEYFE
jgi:hypothetical protein